VIPNIAHFIFGLKEQDEPFHPMHYAAIESCRQVLRPERILFHHIHVPFGPYWDLIAPYLTMIKVGLAPEVLEADYSSNLVPDAYRYAHHADFIRLDALIEHGGVYADIDTLFVRPFPSELFDAAFVIGREPIVRDELSGVVHRSLCNALLMAEPGAQFARAWRAAMGDELNGTWSNHSGYLSERLSREMPEAVRVLPLPTFFPFPPDPSGLRALLEERHILPPTTLSIHLWAHLWWSRDRTEMSRLHGGLCTPSVLRHAQTTISELAAPYLISKAASPAAPSPSARRSDGREPPSDERGLSRTPPTWRYVALDERSGYGIAGERCRDALEGAGVDVDWIPFVAGPSWGLGYEPAFPWMLSEGAVRRSHDSGDPDPTTEATTIDEPVVVAHIVPEYFPTIRERSADSYLVGHTVWETDRLPGHWAACLDRADLVVVPSQFSAQAMHAGNLAPPVEVVPHVAPNTDAPGTGWLDLPEDSVVFYTIAEWNERKAVYKTVEAFLHAFRSRDKVVLIVKTSERDWRHPAPETGGRFQPGTTTFALAQLVAGHRDPPAIRLVTRSLSDAEIVGLHRRGDCFLSLCRSEGWGLGAFDAAAFGVPVITTGFGGHLDYLADSPHLVDFTLIAVEGGGSYTSDQRWADANVDHAAELCRWVASDLASATALAHPLALSIRSTFSPSAVSGALISAVARHRAGSHRPTGRAGS